jgi:hypothetical protein
MKRRTIIGVLAVALGMLLASCQQQPPASSSGETRPETPAPSAPAPSTSGDTQSQAPATTQPAPSTSGDNQPPPAETNPPPSGGPAQ